MGTAQPETDAYYIRRRDGKVFGPFTAAQMEQFIQQGRLGATDLVRSKGANSWDYASQYFAMRAPATADSFSQAALPTPRSSRPVPTPASRPTGHAPRYADWWPRVLACIIDTIACMILISMCGKLLGTVGVKPGGPIDTIVAQAIGFLYFSLMESSSWQATPGKRALSLRVTRANGERLDFGRAAARYIAKIPSFLIFMIGYLMPLWHPKKQGLHDLLADTIVVKD